MADQLGAEVGEHPENRQGLLNIGVDSLVFIDDSPMEIDYMRAARPEGHSVLVPEEPAEILGTMRALAHFDRMEITEGGSRRAEMMWLEQAREEVAGQLLSKEDFPCGASDLKVELFAAPPEELAPHRPVDQQDQPVQPHHHPPLAR